MHVERTGEVEVERLRPWSAVARVPTATGLVWFKESAPTLAFEPALTAYVAARRPDCTAPVLAAEGPRLLTANVGPRLGELLEADEPALAWAEIVVLYAELQIGLAHETETLLALGVPDSRPARIAAKHGAQKLVRRLGDSVPLSLIHEEVHGGNVCVRDGEPVFIDWAEASISHPFSGLVNTLRAVGPEDARRIRDLYLGPWTRFAPLSDLRAVFAAAYALGCLCRSETWSRLLSPLAEEDRGDFDHNVTAWLEIFADALASPDTLGT